MSTTADSDFDLELHFLPAWAKKAPEQNRYEHFAGETPRSERERGPRRDRGARRDDRSRGPRDRSKGPPSRGQKPRRDDERRGGEKARPAAPPLPEVAVAFIPDDKGVESLARQIKMTGRAYPLFDIAQMILQKPERHNVTLATKKGPEDKPLQMLYVCALDDTAWLSEEEAVRYVLDKHFATFYQPERTKIDGPKGTYTFVAQCGMSGAILGPPNYHDYQNQLRKLHAERFSRMPFEAFKARVKIVKDEAVVKKWIEDQSWKTEFVCLNMPESLKLGSREEVEKHFREIHLPNIVKPVETFKMTGTASRSLRSAPLTRAVRFAWEEQKRFPLQIATVLSQQFASHGLQFFKVNRSITHVAVARPHYLDLETVPVSDGIRRIVQHINAHPRRSRRELIEALAPGSQAKPPSTAEPPEPSPEVTAIIGDLHWLVHQGHVIEFANGALENARKPLSRPPSGRVATPLATDASPQEAVASGIATLPGPQTTEGDNQPQAAEVSAATEAVTTSESVPAEPDAPVEVARDVTPSGAEL